MKDPKITVVVTPTLLAALLEADQVLSASRKPAARLARAGLAQLTVSCQVARSKVLLEAVPASAD